MASLHVRDAIGVSPIPDRTLSLCGGWHNTVARGVRCFTRSPDGPVPTPAVRQAFNHQQRCVAIKPRVRRSRFLPCARFTTRRSAVAPGRDNGCTKERIVSTTIVRLLRCGLEPVTSLQDACTAASATFGRRLLHDLDRMWDHCKESL